MTTNSDKGNSNSVEYKKQKTGSSSSSHPLIIGTEPTMTIIGPRTTPRPTESASSSTSSPVEIEENKYVCEVCNKRFQSHQALGGHVSSHKKFQFSMLNTKDALKLEPAKKKYRPRNAKSGKRPSKVCGFDLNKKLEKKDDDEDEREIESTTSSTL